MSLYDYNREIWRLNLYQGDSEPVYLGHVFPETLSWRVFVEGHEIESCLREKEAKWTCEQAVLHRLTEGLKTAGETPPSENAQGSDA